MFYYKNYNFQVFKEIPVSSWKQTEYGYVSELLHEE